MMSKNTRRNFLKTTVGTAAGINLLIQTQAFSANETIRVCVTGINGRGEEHIRAFNAIPNVAVVALCDADENVLGKKKEEWEKKIPRPLKTYTDFREMLKDKDIDVVSIATPNHWHSIMGIWACQAGKDVYIEKPCSHNVYEGRKLVEAARKYKRIVQHGTQTRSSEAMKEAVQLLRDGYLGQVYYAKGLCYKWRKTIDKKPDSPVPAGVHYDLWEGPAPDKPFNENRFHYQWHWNWLYGNGDIGNQGVHEMDVARWGLGVELPTVIQAQGGHFMFDDDQQTPNVLLATFKYPDAQKMLVFEVRHWHTPNELGEINGDARDVVGNIFMGSEGYMTTFGFNQRGYQTYMGMKREKGKGRRDEEGVVHFENFIKAARSRKQEDLTAEILEGHLSAAHCHLANAAYRVQETLRFDPATERVTNNKDADAIIRDADRDYRKPFTIPDEV